MARPGKKPPRAGQGDLFSHAELYPVRRPDTGPRSGDLSLRIKSAMGRALKESPKSAHVLAAEIAEMTGRDLTADALYTYTAPSKPDHEIGITRFFAFVRATGANWLVDVLVEDLGLVVLEGREAHFAQLGLLLQQQSQTDEEITRLRAELAAKPVSVTRRRS